MTAADLDECALRIEDLNAEIVNWTSYTFHTDFLTPTDAFSFTIGDPQLPQGLSGKIVTGQRVTLLINGRPTCTGYIDEWSGDNSRGGGSTLTLTGRDVLGDAVDSCIDPTLRFSEKQTLEDVLREVFTPFGLTTFTADNAANRDLITGNKYGIKVNKTSYTKKGQVTKASGKPVKSFLQHLAKPYQHEGAYEFAERVAKRSGLHLWASADGDSVIAGQPDFDQEPRFELLRKRGREAGSDNNIVGGAVTKSRLNQPSVIVATGCGGGGEFGRGRYKVAMVNELIALDAGANLIPDVTRVLEKHKDAYRISLDDLPGKASPLALNPYPRCRPLYLHDDVSQDLEQLKNYVKREMAVRQQSSLAVTYEVAGHTQNGQTWAVDTVVGVGDDVGDIHEELWIKGVTFTKSRSSGTRTSLTLIRPWTMTF